MIVFSEVSSFFSLFLFISMEFMPKESPKQHQPNEIHKLLFAQINWFYDDYFFVIVAKYGKICIWLWVAPPDISVEWRKRKKNCTKFRNGNQTKWNEKKKFRRKRTRTKYSWFWLVVCYYRPYFTANWVCVFFFVISEDFMNKTEKWFGTK